MNSQQPNSLDDPRIIARIDSYQELPNSERESARTEMLDEFPLLADDLNACLRGLELVEGFVPCVASNADELPISETDSIGHHDLGDFRIIRQIGRGGMGIVYEAEQMSLGRRVAVKVLPFAGMLSVNQLQRFKNEAQAAASLHHPNIVNAFFVGQDRGVHFYAMRLIEGKSLADVIAEFSPFKSETSGNFEPSGVRSLSKETQPVAVLSTERDANRREFYRSIARLGIQAADALSHAHAMGIVHRDIKPSNLLLDADRHLWVTDFGLASTQANTTMTMTGDLIGTLRYMSPEQAAGDRGVVDHRTDIYSLGITLFELITGKPAVRGTDRIQVLRSMGGVVSSPASLEPNTPRDLSNIILTATARAPADRYDSVAEFRDDLQRFIEQRPIKARRPSRLRQLGHWVRRNRTIASLVFVILVVMLFLSIAGPIVVTRQSKLINTTNSMNSNLAVSSAWRAWHAGELDRIETLLDVQRHRSGKTDLRGFPWHHLSNRYKRVWDAPALPHWSRVKHCAFSANGSQILTVCRNGMVRLWLANGLTIVQEFQSHMQRIESAAMSPDALRIAIGTESGLVKVFHASSGTEISELKHDDRALAVTFVTDALLCVGTDDGLITLWNLSDISTPRVENRVAAHDDSGIQTIAVSPDRQQLASSGYDGIVRILTLPKLDSVKTFRTSTTITYQALAYSPNGQMLAVTANNVALWDTNDWTRIGTITVGKRDIGTVAFTADSRHVVAPGMRSTTIWSVDSQQLVHTIGEVRGNIALSPDNRLVAVTHEQTVQIQQFSVPVKQEVDLNVAVPVRFARTTDGLQLLVGTGETASYEGTGSFAVYDVPSLQLKYVEKNLPPVMYIEVSPSDHNIAALAGGVRQGNGTGYVSLRDIESGSEICSLPSTGQTRGISFSHDGSLLAAPQIPNHRIDDSTIDVWDVADRKLLFTFDDFSAFDLCFSRKDKMLIAAGKTKDDKGAIQFYDIEKLSRLETIRTSAPMATCLSVSPDHRQIAVGTFGGNVDLIGYPPTSTRLSTKSTGYQLFSIGHSPDGATVAAGGFDGEVRMWDAQTGDDQALLIASGPVVSLCFSDDGEMLVAGCANRTVTVWYRDGRRVEFACK